MARDHTPKIVEIMCCLLRQRNNPCLTEWARVINSMCYILGTALTAAIQKWSKPPPGGIQNLAVFEVFDPQMYPSREAQISNRQ